MRQSQRQLAEAKNTVLREEMERAVADGRLVIRTMTADERDQSDARWTAATEGRGNRGAKRHAGIGA